MEYRHLGSSSLQVSNVSVGCMSLGHDHVQNASILLKAYDSGINFFDTANIYADGENEITVGKALREIRDEVIIATKVGNVRRADGGLDWNASKKHILESVEGSLRRLQTSYIDLYQLHGGMITDNIDETIEAFEQLREQGKIRYYGISSIRPNVIREYVKRSNIVSVMMQYSLLDRRPEEACLSLLREHNIGVLARGSLASGLLVSKPAAPYLTHSADVVTQASEAIGSFSGDVRTKTDTAVQFVLSDPAITTAVVGVRNEGQLKEAVHAAGAPALSVVEVSGLRAVIQANVYGDHR